MILLVLTTLLTCAKGLNEPSIFLVPALYSYGDCSAVPSPQTLTLYINTLSEDGKSQALLIGTGRSTTGALWVQSRDNDIENVFEYPLIALNEEALYKFFCLNYYCFGKPTEEVIMESNGTCDVMEAASGVYSYINRDPRVSFIIANKGPDFMHVYAALPISEQEDATYYILNPSRHRADYIQGFALRALENGTEVTIVPTEAVSIFRPAMLELVTETVEAYEEYVIYFDPLETVWIEVEVESCDSTASLTGTLVRASYELAVFSAQALCNETTNSMADDQNEVLSFSYIFSPLRQLPPVSRWGTQYITDLTKLHLFPEKDEEFYIISFSILASAESEVSITCYGPNARKVCSAKQILGEGEVWQYKVQLKTMLEAEVMFIEGSNSILVLHEAYSQEEDTVYHSEVLQPNRWFSRKQMVPVLHSLDADSLDARPEVFTVNLVIPATYVKMPQIRVWDSRDNEQPTKLEDFKLISNHSSSAVQGHTIVRIGLDPAAYNGVDYVLQFTITDTSSGEDVKFGASIFSFGGYAYSNGYLLGSQKHTTQISTRGKPQLIIYTANKREQWTTVSSKSNLQLGVVVGVCVGTATLLLAVVTVLVLVCHMRGVIVLPWLLPPPSQGFEYDVFLSFADDDREFAQKILYEPLTSKGYRVLLHLTDFIAGVTIEDNISRAVKISRVVIYVCSEKFNQSSFCQTELKYGMESHYNKYKGRYRRVIPVWIGGKCPSELNTFRIRPIKASELVEDYSKESIECLLKSLHLGRLTNGRHINMVEPTVQES